MFKKIHKNSVSKGLDMDSDKHKTKLSKLLRKPSVLILTGMIVVGGLLFSYKALEMGMQKIKWENIWDTILIGKKRYDIQFSEISQSTNQKSLTYLIYAKKQNNKHILDVDYLLNLSTGSYWYQWGVTWNNISNKILGKNQFYAVYSVVDERTDKSLSSGFDLRTPKGNKILGIDTGKVAIGGYLKFDGPVHEGDILFVGIIKKGSNTIDMFVKDLKTNAEAKIKISVPDQKDLTNKKNQTGKYLLSKGFFTGPMEEIHSTSYNIKLDKETFYGVKYPHDYSKLYINKSHMYTTGKGYVIMIKPSKQYLFVNDKFYIETNNRNSIFSVSSTPVQFLYPYEKYITYVLKDNKQSSSKNK